jgi:hypothetical protein
MNREQTASNKPPTSRAEKIVQNTLTHERITVIVYMTNGA